MGRPIGKNRVLSIVGGVVRVDVSTKTHKNKSMLIDYKDWVNIQSLNIGRIIAVKSRKTFYASSLVSGKSKKVHRLILSDSVVIDHINHNGLDNRRKNLRKCTQSENMMNRGMLSNNTSGLIGVSWSSSAKKWKAQIRINKALIYLGVYDDKCDAHEAYKKARDDKFGEFAYKGEAK